MLVTLSPSSRLGKFLLFLPFVVRLGGFFGEDVIGDGNNDHRDAKGNLGEVQLFSEINNHNGARSIR